LDYRANQTGAVTTARIDYSNSNTDHLLFISSDLHIDSVLCNRDKLLGDLTDAKERGAMILLIGDVFDAMQGRFDPRRSLDELLAQGVPVMVQVDYNPKTSYIDQHWVLIIGKNGDDYIINDPIDGKRVSFRERYGDPARWIFRIAAYRRLQ
jgi:hypothetical protein